MKRFFLFFLLLSVFLTACTPEDADWSAVSEQTEASPTRVYAIADVSAYSNVCSDISRYLTGLSTERITAQDFNRYIEDASIRDGITVFYHQGTQYDFEYTRTVNAPHKRLLYDVYAAPNDTSYVELAVAHGTEKLIGMENAVNHSMWSNPPKTYAGDEAMLAAARNFMSQFVSEGTYAYHEVRNMGTTTIVTFYNEIDGIRVGDYATVTLFRDGTVINGYAQPERDIYETVTERIDTAACDLAAQEKLTSVYQFSDRETSQAISSQITSTELTGRFLTLDDQGVPTVYYEYTVQVIMTFADGHTEERGDFVDILVRLQ